MTDETRKQIALARYKLISPVLAESGRNRNEWFREQAGKTHHFPHYGAKAVAVSTLKSWMKAYREKGLRRPFAQEALRRGAPAPPGRAGDGGDSREVQGPPRVVGAEAVRGPDVENAQLGERPICYNTLLRVVKREDLLPAAGRTDQRKRFEMPGGERDVDVRFHARSEGGAARRSPCKEHLVRGDRRPLPGDRGARLQHEGDGLGADGGFEGGV